LSDITGCRIAQVPLQYQSIL